VTAPIADEVLALADGRLLAWAEWGDPRGVPLIFFHPAPGSRMLCPDPAATTAAGVRLITIDRPGYGRSDPVGAPTLAAFAEDLERLLDHLWLGQVPVVGWAEGGQCAAACAAALSDRISALALVATPAPDAEVRWLTPPLQRVADLAKHDPPRAMAAAVEWAGPMAGAPERAGVGWDSPADVVVRSRPEVEQALLTMWAEAFRAGARGLAADMVAGCRPEDFAFAAVRASLFYGQDDPVIDPAHGRWWAQALPRAQLTIRPGSGHLVPFVAWADILTAVVQSPSKERND
jgi:pimeloyl-ACP methyl ester carboxylesterase